MTENDFPALFKTADSASYSLQKFFLNLVKAEYALLFAAASMTLVDSKDPIFLGLYAFVFIASLGVLAWRYHARPEQGWYKARALAESVKTLSWRYSMRAEPFDDARQADANEDFRDSLAALLRANRQLGEHLSGLDATGQQITKPMSDMRGSGFIERKAFYLRSRVADQKSWYAGKAKKNKDAARNWQLLSVACYIAGVVMVLLKVQFVDAVLPIEPIIVVASAVIGWIQIKKFNELSSAYALTAHEIGLAEIVIQDAKSDVDLSRAVNEVELVFSREHTQWIARQTAGD